MNYIYYQSLLLTRTFFRLFENVKYKNVPVARAMVFAFHRHAVQYYTRKKEKPQKNWQRGKSKLYSLLIATEPLRHIPYRHQPKATEKIIYSPYSHAGLSINPKESIICGQNRSEKSQLRGLRVPYCIPKQMSPLNQKSYAILLRKIKAIIKRKNSPPYFKRTAFLKWISNSLKSVMQTIDGIYKLFSANRIKGIVLHSTVHPLGYLLVHMGKQRRIPTIITQSFVNDDYQLFSTYVDHYIAWGGLHQKRLTQFGVPTRKFVLLGNARFDPIFRGKWKSKAQIAKMFSFPRKKIVFVYPEQPLRASHNKIAMNKILKALSPFKNRIILLVKEHPRQKKKSLSTHQLKKHPFVKKVSSGKVHIYHLLNGADAVFTQFSTVGTEAILLNKPLIALSFFPNTVRHEYTYYSANRLITSAKNQKQLNIIISTFIRSTPYKKSILKRQQRYRKNTYHGTISATRIKRFIQAKTG